MTILEGFGESSLVLFYDTIMEFT